MAKKQKDQIGQHQKVNAISESKTSEWLFLGPILILTFILYSGTLKNYFIINWDDDGYTLHQCHVGGVGQDGQSRRGARLHVAVDLATLQAKHLRDVLEPHAISVAV